MTSRVAVMRKTGDTTTDENGYEVPEWAAVHVDVPFRLGATSTGDGGSRSVTVGGVTFDEATAVGHFTAATADLADEDYIDIASGEWAGSVFRIVEAVKGDQRTARRVPTAETPRPEEWS